MKDVAFNLLLIVLIKAVSAVAAYLKDRLTGNIRRGDNKPFDPDYACC
ncbi:hypothetical protein [Paraburkholderia aromaticivorans]|nr:hypothetical protein [Paraburkholderia aromaticivorans]